MPVVTFVDASPSPPVFNNCTSALMYLSACVTVCTLFLLQACTLGVKYKEGQLRAYQLLCRMLLERYDRPLPADFLTHSYRLLHIALTSQDRDLMDCVVWHSSTIFSTNLPGATILIGDYLNAAEKVLTSSDSAVSLNVAPVPILH